MKNYGLNLVLEKEHQSEEDWVFGSTSQKCIATIPEYLRIDYLPEGEKQHGREDMADCASRSVVNIIETKLNYLYQEGIDLNFSEWLEKKGYIMNGKVAISDAFIAIKSGTTKAGNSLKAPVDTTHRVGVIPKAMLPYNPEMTWEEYHNPNRITPEMEKLGLEFLKRVNINYDRVNKDNFVEALKDNMIDVAGLAWPHPNSEGEYPRIEGQPNHAFMAIKTPAYFIFDNYIDSVDKDYIKKLASDFNLWDYGYRIFLSFNKKKDGLSDSIGRFLYPIIKFIKYIFSWQS